MAWNKNDYLAALLIIIILAVAAIAGLYISGTFNPNINTVFPFK